MISQNLITMALLLCGSVALAQSPSGGSDKLDLKKLEDKYWAAKDTDLSVVQNRTYSKDGRPFVSLSYGALMNDAYSYGRMTNVAAGYYFSERWGLELSYEKGSLKQNSAIDAISSQNGLNPNYNKYVDYTSLNAIWVPFYAKMSFLDRKIMYFDMQFAAGLGKMTYDSQIDPLESSNERQTVTGYNLDFTQQLFFSPHFAVRLDIKNKWTKQNLRVFRLSGSAFPTREALGSTNQQDTTILLGLTFFFGSNGQ